MSNSKASTARFPAMRGRTFSSRPNCRSGNFRRPQTCHETRWRDPAPGPLSAFPSAPLLKRLAHVVGGIRDVFDLRPQILNQLFGAEAGAVFRQLVVTVRDAGHDSGVGPRGF